MGHSYHYEILSWTPRTDQVMSRWGFTIRMDYQMAKILKSKKITEQHYDRITELGKDVIISIFGKEDPMVKHLHPPYQFWDDTYLLTNLSVPGNACGLDMSNGDFERINSDNEYESEWNCVEWHPHNVDVNQQASTLLAIWLRWFSLAKMIAEEK